MNTEQKFCRDCVHLKDRDCTWWKHLDLVTGESEVIKVPASWERDFETHRKGFNSIEPCGPDARHFEQKPAEAVAPIVVPKFSIPARIEKVVGDPLGFVFAGLGLALLYVLVAVIFWKP